MPQNKKRSGSRKRKIRRSYRNYSPEMLEIAVNLVKSKKISSYDAEKQFGIPRRTILNKANNRHEKSIGHPTRLSSEDEIKIADTINVAAEFGCPLTVLDLRIVVYHYLQSNNKSDIFHGKMPGERWARNFLTRHNMTKRKTQNIKRSRAAKSVAELNDYFQNLEVSIKNVPPTHLLNYDETNLSDDPGCSQAIFKKGVKHPEVVLNSSKSSVSIMFAGTADGKCLPPYVIYKSEHLWSRWCQDGPVGCLYNRTKSGWFDMASFEDWFEKMILPWATGLDGPKVIIGDNLSSHLSVKIINLCRENNIKFVFLPRNGTHLTQPLDLAFFGPMKRLWRKIMLEYKLSNQNATSINKCHFPQLLKKLMEKLEISGEQNLKSGFEAAGIFPFNPLKVTKNIPQETEQMRQTFDKTLLDYLKASREPKPISGGRNFKLQVTAGKSISEIDVLEPKKQFKNKEELNSVSKPKVPKITILSDIRIKKENIAFCGKENSPFNLLTLDKHFDLTSCKKSKKDREPLEKITTNKTECGTLSNNDGEVKQNFLAKTIKSKKSGLYMKQTNKKNKVKGNKKCRKVLDSSTTTDSDIDISEHDDSDICDVLSDSVTDNSINCITFEPQILHNRDEIEEELMETCNSNEIIDDSLDEVHVCLNNDNLEISQNKTSAKHNSQEENSRQVLNNHKEMFNIGDTVLTRYYMRKSWKYYIGTIESKDSVTGQYSINYFKTIGKSNDKKFIKPKRFVDKDIIPENSIVKVVQLLQIKENPDEYVLMQDEDNVYFS